MEYGLGWYLLAALVGVAGVFYVVGLLYYLDKAIRRPIKPGQD